MHVHVGVGHGAGTGRRRARAASSGAAAARAASVGRRRRAQVQLTIRLFDGAEDVGDGKRRRVRLVFGAQGHRQIGTIELGQEVGRLLEPAGEAGRRGARMKNGRSG